MARNQRVRADRHHQRRTEGYNRLLNRSSAPFAIAEPRALGPPDTIPLHPQTAGRNPDFMLIARSKLNSRHTDPTAAAATRVVVRNCRYGRLRTFVNEESEPLGIMLDLGAA